MQGMPSIASLRWPAVALVAYGGILSSTRAEARPEGIASDCFGCHGSDAEAMLSLSAGAPEIIPGTEVNFTLLVSRPGAQVGGMFVSDPGVGQLGTIPGEGLALRSEGLTHTSPKAAQNGTVSFRFTWRAPDQPGYVRISAYGNAANGDGTRGGDAPSAGDFFFTFGCPPMTFYIDGDRDGHGSRDRPTLVACADQPPPEGLAVASDDCDDTRATRYPGAEEICNLFDDDCDGRVDEGLRPECGVGFCRRQSFTCDPEDCQPGEPSPETCNFLDDDCNGVVDDGDLCAVGSGCVDGQCRAGALPTTSEDAAGADDGPAGPTAMGVDGPAVAGGGEPRASSAEAAGCTFAAGKALPRARLAALVGGIVAVAAFASRAARRKRRSRVGNALC